MQIWTKLTVVASGLGFPEGPAVLADGSILVCDIRAGLVRRIEGDEHSIFSNVGGGPNGIAVSPDGWVYVANNGGAMRWAERDGEINSEGFLEKGFDSRVERICISSGRIERLLDTVDGRPFQAINDLVFDPDEGFWFSDLGRDGSRSRSYGGIYWASLDGTRCIEAAYPLPMGANGIGLSPDGSTLYATEYGAGRVWIWEVLEPGALKKSGPRPHGGSLLWQSGHAALLDSIAVAANGNLVIATQPTGVFSVVSSRGDLIGTLDMPEHFPTNLCFSPTDPTVAFATLSNTGRLARLDLDPDLFGKSTS